ncbi:MAG: hypothetical protein ACYDC1_15530 [Limisphaerales bacterium]
MPTQRHREQRDQLSPHHARRLHASLARGKVKPDAGAPEPFGSTNTLGFGTPQQEDLKLIRYLREEFKKTDPT